MKRRYEVLKLFAESFAECAECGEMESCSPDCMIQETSEMTSEHEFETPYRRMLDARLALYGALE